MKRMYRWLIASVFAVCVVPAHAAFHLFRIDQVFSNADTSVQYVVLREVTGSDFESFWMGNTLRTTGMGGAMTSFQFPSNLPSTSTASRSVLVATSGFAALGLVAPDYVVSNGFIPITGGSMNYAGVDQIALPALPTDGATAIDRNGNHVAATPRNFAGATTTLTAPPPPGGAPDLNQHGLTGSWYEPATSGQGIEVEFYPDFVAPGTALVAGAWFTFDSAPIGGSDRERWYTFSGNGQTGQPSVPVTILQNVGGNFNAPPITNSTVVGSGTLAFTTCDTGTFDYTFTDGSGRHGMIPLTRIAPNVTCAAGTTPTTNPDFGLSGNWYTAATSGQGFLFEVNPVAPALFFTWYTYAPGGQAAGVAGQRWFTGFAAYTMGSRSVVVDLEETTGGLFDLVTNPAPVTRSVGSATVTFSSCAAAQLNFNFVSGSMAGQAGMISLARIGPVPAGCQGAAASAAPDPMMMPPGMGYPPYGPA